MLDSMIRIKLRKQGITLTHNIYAGYDSEYKKIDMKYNKLLSVQLALSTQSVLKLPLNTEYNFGYKSKSGSLINESESPILDSDKILGELRHGIKMYRKLKYGGHDESLSRLITGVKDFGKSYITDDEHLYIIYANTPVKQYFNRLDSYSLKTLVTKSKELVDPSLSCSERQIFDELKNLFEKSLPSDTLDSFPQGS